jgi:GT2 family glycosyltransferase/glycosyltransferase involved in cell wall biosynthesis
VTISVLLWGPCARVCEQIASLSDAHAGLEVLVATDEPLEQASAARVLTSAGVGRHAAWRLAAGAARGDVLVAFDALGEPTLDVIEQLAGAVRAGAALAAPAIASANRTAYGYRATRDGAVWPNDAPGAETAAVALDCLAGRPHLFATVPAWDVVAGHYELQVVAHARTLGAVRVVVGATLRRYAQGPSLSIVVCTRDRGDEIAECVESCLALDLRGNDAELIVVDNGSSDGTASTLSGLAAAHPGQLSIVHEPVPGLSRARNAGASVATGELLTFLDDDARPAPGWLEHIRLAFVDPDVAIAGGPICGLWPDGRPDGFPPASTEPYLGILDRGDAPHDSARPEDGPWGGNWTGRRAVIDALGGFDVRFGAGESGNLGGEEVHLGWRVVDGELGRLRFVPGAAIGHRAPHARLDERYVLLRAFRCGIEDVRMQEVLGRTGAGALDSIGGHAAARLARFTPHGRRDVESVLEEIAGSRMPLLARIDGAGALGQIVGIATARGAESIALDRSVIAIRPEHAGGRVRPIGDGPELLVCFPDVPDPTRSAGHARAFELLHSLRRLGRRPVLFVLGSAGADATLRQLARDGIEVHCADRGAGFGDLAARRFPVAIVSFFDIAERIVPTLRSLSPETRIIVDSVDLHFRRMLREGELLGDRARIDEAASVRLRELAVYRAADVVLAVSDEEQDLLCELVPGTPVGILPNVHHPLAASQSPAGRSGALFVGSFGHAPNVDAVRFLCADVLPALRALGDDTEIAIAGSAMPDELAAWARAAGAVVLGFVPSVDAELEHRRLSLAPLRFGAGLKGKVGESLAAGVPVVGTAVAAEGFAGHAEAMLVATDASSLARSIARLAHDDALWQRLSDAGRALIAESFGPERCDRELADVLGFLDPVAHAA